MIRPRLLPQRCILLADPLLSCPSPRRHSASLYRYSTAPTPLIRERNIPAPHTGSIRVLTLDRPSARNAISRGLLAELSTHIERLHLEQPADGQGVGSTRALVLASAVDGVFCAGADLKERATFTKEETKSFLTSLRSTLSLLSKLAIPSISCVAGPALGGGLELALCTDLRVFSSGASVGLPETRLGIIPGAGGTRRLPALIGLNRARDLVLTGRRVGAGEAYFLGLCDRVVDVEGRPVAEASRTALDHALALARDVCDGAPLAVMAAKRAVEAWSAEPGREEMEYDAVVGTRDRDEALVAFREKRHPIFKGR
ncbi:MAG: hypothetical protein M1825_005291 [Sarcosagium campestre]|nr:MAG: hypothetical protein M1825_005291 [Sarcosagium campestre]